MPDTIVLVGYRIESSLGLFSVIYDNKIYLDVYDVARKQITKLKLEKKY